MEQNQLENILYQGFSFPHTQKFPNRELISERLCHFSLIDFDYEMESPEMY